MQWLTNCKKILNSSGGLRMYCVGEIESFTKSRQDLGKKPTSLESEYPRKSKKPCGLIRLPRLTFGDSPFRRIWLM